MSLEGGISLFPFFLAQIMGMPMMGIGVFTSHAPQALLRVVGSLIGHLAYGGGTPGLVADRPERIERTVSAA